MLDYNLGKCLYFTLVKALESKYHASRAMGILRKQESLNKTVY